MFSPHRLHSAALAAAAGLLLASPPPHGAGAPRAAPGAALPRAPRPVTIAAVGDIQFGRIIRRRRGGRQVEHYRPAGLDRPFRHVRSLLAGHDIVLGNLETPITGRDIGPKLLFRFRARPEAATLLRGGGFTVLGTANNHAFDQRDVGVRETLQHLWRAGLGTAGTGLTAEAAWQPYRTTVRGLRVSVFAATTRHNRRLAQEVGFLAWRARRREVFDEILRRVRRERSRADLIVLSLHWGRERQSRAEPSAIAFAREARAAGVNLIVGHHPHVLRGVERRPGFVAFYSLGDFLFDRGWPSEREGGLARLEVVRTPAGVRFRRALLLPIRQTRKRLPQLAVGRVAARVRARVRRLSHRIDRRTRFGRIGEALEIRLPPGR